MKYIAVTITERPQYLDRMLCSLQINQARDWKLIASLEPNAKESEFLLKSTLNIQVEALRNKFLKGVRENPYYLLRDLFSNPELESVLYLEEDLILSPDALDLAAWYMKGPFEDDVLCYSLFNYNSISGLDDELIKTDENFSPLGFVLTREQWEKHFKPNWDKDWRGWDWSIVEYQNKKRLKIVQPRLSRTNHIGDEGTHTDVSICKNIFHGLKMSDGASRNYHIVKKNWSMIVPYAMRRPYMEKNLKQIATQNKHILEHGEIIIPIIRECDAEDIRGLKQENLDIKILHLDVEKNIFKSGAYHFPMALQIFGNNCGVRVSGAETLIFSAPEVISPGESIMALSSFPNSYLRTIYVYWDLKELPIFNYEYFYKSRKQDGKEDSWYASCRERQLYFIFSMRRKDVLRIGGLYNEQYVYASDYGDNELARRLKRKKIEMKEQEACFALHVHHERNLIDNVQNKTWYETNKKQVLNWGHHSTLKLIEKI